MGYPVDTSRVFIIWENVYIFSPCALSKRGCLRPRKKKVLISRGFDFIQFYKNFKISILELLRSNLFCIMYSFLLLKNTGFKKLKGLEY